MMDSSLRLTLNTPDRNTAMDSSCWSKFSIRAGDLVTAVSGDTVVLMSRVGNLGDMKTGFSLYIHHDCAQLFRQMASDLDAIAASAQAADSRRI